MVVVNKTYALHEGLAFWAYDYHANTATCSWVFAHYSSMVDVPTGVPNHIVKASTCMGLIQAAYKNQAASTRWTWPLKLGVGLLCVVSLTCSTRCTPSSYSTQEGRRYSSCTSSR